MEQRKKVKKRRRRILHRRLTQGGVPLKKDGNRLGLRRRREIAEFEV